jgi:hypothetical protein
LVGFLSAFGSFVFATGGLETPSWVHTTRIAVAWIAVITVFVWFVAGHEGPLVKHFTIVTILTWLGFELVAAGLGVIIARYTDVPDWGFQLRNVVGTLLLALAGLAIGSVIRGRRLRTFVGSGK